MLTEITKAQLLNWRLGVLMNEGKATTAQISLAKRNNIKIALEMWRVKHDKYMVAWALLVSIR
jgi:glutaryl-CoA dehydrogenase